MLASAFLEGHPQSFDVVDLSTEWMDQGEANKYAATVEFFRESIRSLKPGGLFSISSSVREFTVYALKLIETARRALEAEGVKDPAAHLVVVRSAWSARLLVFRDPVTAEEAKTLSAFCDRRSFDVSLCPGLKELPPIWNDLPPFAIDEESTFERTETARDSLRREGAALLSSENEKFRKEHFFNLEPATWDRPFFTSVLRLSKLPGIGRFLSLIPREEIAILINLTVMLQALILAFLVLSLPLLKRGTRPPEGSGVKRLILYFAGLGLGFLFVEIALIEKASWFLGDRTMAFSLILCVMLVASGAGSWTAGTFENRLHRGQGWAVGGALIWLLFAALGMNALMDAFLSWGVILKCILLIVLTAPIGFALGLPFPLGLSALREDKTGWLPWAWALNGSFSVLATPMANLFAMQFGYRLLWGLAAGLYAVSYFAFPRSKTR